MGEEKAFYDQSDKHDLKVAVLMSFVFTFSETFSNIHR
jgi:hypothetical protein